MADSEVEWAGGGSLREQIAEWTRHRGKSPRLHAGALIRCLRRPGRDLRDIVEFVGRGDFGPDTATSTLRLVGTVHPEVWNRLGTRILSKLRSGLSRAAVARLAPRYTGRVFARQCGSRRGERGPRSGRARWVDVAVGLMA